MKDACYLLPSAFKPSNGRENISVRRTASMGDCIAATVVADRLIEKGFNVTFAAHERFHPVLKLHPRIQGLKNQQYIADVTLDKAYEEHPQRRVRSFWDLFIEFANRQLEQRNIRLEPKNCRPMFHVEHYIQMRAKSVFDPYPHPWVIVVPRAAIPWYGRCVVNGTWQAAVPKINGTCFWLGMDPAPFGFIDLHCREIEWIASYICHADLVVTVDTGPMHLAAALRKPILAILQASSPALHLNDQVDFDMIAPKLDCLNCQKNVCPINATHPPCQEIDPEMIVQATNTKLRAITQNEVGAVIAVLRPEAPMLNKCLTAVLPQVSHVVVTRDAAGQLPTGIIQDPKIRWVTTPQPNIGVGRNFNFGVRHTWAKYVLLLNDDVYLAANSIERLMESMKDGVGAVAHLLHYPDGRIYFANKLRSPDGQIGHYHLDHQKNRHTITAPCESENLCMASVLIRRKAFYEAGGFDERFFAYAEDDCLSMNLRRLGWKLFYTPYADGIHDEHAETKKLPDRMKIMAQSNALFGQLWGRFYQHNKGNPNLGNFDYENKK